MASNGSIGTFICYLHVSPFHTIDLCSLTDITKTQLLRGEKKARHNIDVARIQLFIRSQEYEDARTTLEHNLATCERKLAKLSERISAVEADQASWNDETDPLKWLDRFKSELLLEAFEKTYKLWKNRKRDQNNELNRKRENFERRQARWQERLDQALNDAEGFKKEIAKVVEKIQGTT